MLRRRQPIALLIAGLAVIASLGARRLYLSIGEGGGREGVSMSEVHDRENTFSPSVQQRGGQPTRSLDDSEDSETVMTLHGNQESDVDPREITLLIAQALGGDTINKAAVIRLENLGKLAAESDIPYPYALDDNSVLSREFSEWCEQTNCDTPTMMRVSIHRSSYILGLQVVGLIKREAAIDLLRKALHSGHPLMAMRAAHELGWLQSDSDALDVLRVAESYDPGEFVSFASGLLLFNDEEINQAVRRQVSDELYADLVRNAARESERRSAILEKFNISLSASGDS